MSYEISVSASGTHVVCVIKEPVTAEVAREVSRKSVEVARSHGLIRFLFDARAVKNVESVAGNYDFAYSDMAALGIQQRFRTALLVAPDDRSHDFVEIVTRNAGYNVRIFSEEDAAVSWLTEESHD